MKIKIIFIQVFSIMAILIISNSSNLKAYNVEFYSINQTMNKNNNNNNNMNLDISNLVFELDSNPFNIPYSDWTAKWWQWAYSIPKDIHPAYDNTGKFCHVNQK